MIRFFEILFNRGKKLKAGIIILFFAALSLLLSAPALAANNGVNQWPGGRIGYRLDTHFGQVAANAPDIPLYLDDACTKPNGAHRLEAGDWAVVFFPANQYGNYGVTYPITEPQSGGVDSGDEYTTHYIKGSDLHYIVSGTGNFSGTDWDENTWWNHLPTNISYTSAFPGNGDTTYVGNNVDGGVGGGFNVYPVGNEYYELFSGDNSAEVMFGSLFKYCWYDDSHTDFTDADYSWSMLSQGWSQAGLHEGTNLVSYAGMDASGNFLTGQRYLKWDTKAPLMDTNLNGIQNSPGHHGWLNLADFNSDQKVVVRSHDDTSQTTDVSGLNLHSLQTIFDGVNCWGDSGGYQGFDYYDGTNWVKSMSLHSTMQAMGVQNDGTGGQGTHSFQFSSIDNAWNTAVIGASVQIDTIPPAVTYAPNSTSGWTTSQSVTISVADPGSDNGTGSGLASASYQISTDGGQTWGAATSFNKSTTVNLPAGTDVIRTTAADVAGNTSTTDSGQYLIDTTPPVVTYTPNSSPWTNHLIVTINVTDAGGSGVQAAYWHISTDGGKTWTGQNQFTTSTTVDLPQGTIMLRTDAYDNAGNSASYDSGIYLIDKTPPVITYTPGSSGGWKQNLSPTISVTDSGGSGLASSKYRLSTDGGQTWGGYTAFPASTYLDLPEGQDVLETIAADNAGNITDFKSGVYQIDRTPPTCAAHPVSGQFNSSTDGVAVALTFADNLSGVNASTEQFQWVQAGNSPQDNAWQSYTGQTLTQTGKAQWLLYWKATDNAGNVGTGSFGPYYVGTLTGQIVNPNYNYLPGEDVVVSVLVHSNSSGDITPANNASVTFTAVATNGAGGPATTLITQTKSLVVPNGQTQLVWFRFNLADYADNGHVDMTAKINSTMADAQTNPFSISKLCAPPFETTEDDMGDALEMPSDYDASTPLPANTAPSSGSWQEWTYDGGSFTQHTYTVNAGTSFKIAADPDDPTGITDDNGNVTMKAGYGFMEKPTTTVSTNYGDMNAITGVQWLMGLYPEWNYQQTGGRIMNQTSSQTAGGTITQTFDLPDNPTFSEGKLTDACMARLKAKDVHFTPLAMTQGTYTAEIQAGEIWTPAGKLEASATDSMEIRGNLTKDWRVSDTNPYVLKNK